MQENFMSQAVTDSQRCINSQVKSLRDSVDKPRNASVVSDTRLVHVKRPFCFRQRMLLLVEVFRRF